MYEEFVGVKLCGGSFEKDTILELFPEKNTTRLSLVYGKNGTGKSTLSRGISYVIEGSADGILDAKFVDENNNELVLDDNAKKNVYVFNENFIDSNIKIKKEGIDTIVVLGNKEDVEKKLAEQEQKHVKEENDLNTSKALLEFFLDKNNGESPECYKQKILSSLKGMENWAGRKSKIEGKTVAARVTENLIETFANISPSGTKDALVIEFDKKMVELQEIQQGVKKIPKEVTIRYELNFDEDTILEELARKIEKPVLSEREKFLVSLGTERAKEIKTYFSSDEHNTCPFCLQDVKNGYKTSLFKEIENVLNEKVAEHEKVLNEYNLNEIVWDDADFFRIVDADLVDEIERAISAFNGGIGTLVRLISTKIDEIYTPVCEQKRDFNSQLKKIKELIQALENKRKQYNENAVDPTGVIAELYRINDEMAACDIKGDYDNYKQSEKKQKRLEVNVKKCEDEYNATSQMITSLKDEIRNVDVAVDKINNGLKCIFFNKTRLNIQLQDGKYCLLSRNKPVPPNRISVGERNAIALCYYFCMVMKDRNPDTMYNDEYLLVLDDPISSFDIDNRIGNLSFLKSQLARFMSGNRETKVAVLTHDAQTMLDLERLAEDIRMECKLNGFDSIPKHAKWAKTLRMEDNLLKRFETSQSEYSFLLKSIFDFADNNADQNMFFIGNAMRRVLEAYGTFVYKIGPTQMLTEPSIKKALGDDLFEYYEHLAYRLLFNGGSHLEDRVKTLEDINILDYTSIDEMKKTARDIICLLYILNDQHIINHLECKNDAAKVAIIDGWAETLKRECNC